MPTTALLLVLAKATVVLVAALALDYGLRRASAGARHLVWLAALGAMLLVPALAVWAPLRVAVPMTAGAGTAEATTVEAGTAESMTAGPAVPAPTVPSPPVVSVSSVPAPAFLRPSLGLVPSALLVWGLVGLVIVASLARAWLLVRGIVRRATPLESEDWLAPLWEVSDRLALDEAPRLLRSAETNMPFACGLRRPTVVLPAQSDDWTPARRRAVLLHELAHVRRRDLAGHTLAQIVCAAYWFHPLVWAAAQRLRAESERACDDLALACGARASDYAEHLLDIVASVRRDTTPHAALAMARRSEFEGRMLDILDPDRTRATPGRRQAATLVGGLAVVTLLVGVVTPSTATPTPATPATATRETATPDTATRADSSTAARVAARPDERDSTPASGVSPRERLHERMRTRMEENMRAYVGEQTREQTRESIVVRVVPGAIVSRGVSNEAIDALVNRALRERSQPAVEDGDARTAALAKVLRTDTSASLRRVAAWGLAERARSTMAIAALTAALRGDASASVREMAAWALAQARGGAAVEALGVAARDDADVQVRASAVWALGSLGDRAAVSAVTSALGDASAEVRRAAVWALGSVGTREAPRQLVAMLGDADPTVRRLTAWALFTIEDPSTVSALQSAFRTERDAGLRTAYVRALASLGERSVDALTDLLASSDPETRDVAVRALAGGRATGPWPWPWPRPRPFP
jgi:beta-lactamase regulating signal transducer with metallopeptidase domain